MPHEGHEAARSIHLEGTGSWIFDSSEFQQWYQKEQALWITGVRGSQAGARKQPPSWEVLEDAIAYFSSGRRILLLIDALDECSQKNDLAGFFSRLRETKVRVSVLITSRNEIDIEDALQSLPRLQLEARRAEVDSDIEKYIEQRIEAHDSMKFLAPPIKAEIQNSLHGFTDPIIGRIANECRFRWAQCQLDVLSQLRTVRAIRKNLAELPKGLFQTYERMLMRDNVEDMMILRKILLWVAFAPIPLKIEALHEAIAIDADMTRLEEVEESRLNNPKDIFSLGGSLLAVLEEGTVKLAHLSVRDYLLSKDIKNNPEISMFGMDLIGANEELARCYFAYLSLDSLSSGPCRAQEDWERRRAQHPLLNHAAKGWTHHIRVAGITSELHRVLTDFFKPGPRFMSWIQVLNTDWIFKWDEYPRHATPLYYAASFGLKEIVEGLVQRGAPSTRGQPIRWYRAARRHAPRTPGADPSKADHNLLSPLQTAASAGNDEIVKLLLDYGATAEAADNLGETPCSRVEKAVQVVSRRLPAGEEWQQADAASKL
ncbi:uncharacterized protein PG998_010226 [Apiospora kogelbergensis]|uniref:uncharacterized protein n=1 Tax=Apiospora kogelbergensis TaxID=1337665 RepID=UPI00312F9719